MVPQVKTTAAPQQTPASSPEAEDVVDKETPPPEAIKSPQEKEADKNAIKTMLKGDDYILEKVVKYLIYNAPFLIEEINKRVNNPHLKETDFLTRKLK